MGVFDRAKAVSGISAATEDATPYVCIFCGETFEVQHHRCPDCNSFDIRYSRWVQE